MDIFIFLGEQYQHILLLTLLWGSRSQVQSAELNPCQWLPRWQAHAGKDDKNFTTNSSKQALQLQIFKRKLWFQEYLFALENVIWVSGYAGSHKLLYPVVPAWFQKTSTYSRNFPSLVSALKWFGSLTEAHHHFYHLQPSLMYTIPQDLHNCWTGCHTHYPHSAEPCMP